MLSRESPPKRLPADVMELIRKAIRFLIDRNPVIQTNTEDERRARKMNAMDVDDAGRSAVGWRRYDGVGSLVKMLTRRFNQMSLKKTS